MPFLETNLRKLILLIGERRCVPVQDSGSLEWEFELATVSMLVSVARCFVLLKLPLQIERYCPTVVGNMLIDSPY